MGLHEEDVIAKEMAWQVEDDCNSGVVAIMGNEGMLDQKVFVELFKIAVMVPKWEMERK